MTPSEVAAAYLALGPMGEDLPGERTWFGRVNTLEKFLDAGQESADLFRLLAADSRDGMADVRREFGHIHPALFNLLMQAFPPAS